MKNIHIGQKIAKENIKIAQAYMKSQYDEKAKDPQFEVGDKVLIRDTMKKKNPKFLPKYRGPYTLTKRLSPVAFELDNSQDRRMTNISHVNRMKPRVSLDERIIHNPTAIKTPLNIRNI